MRTPLRMLWAGLGCLAIGVAATPAAGASEPGFEEWLEGVRAEAREQGISEATIAAALSDVKLLPQALKEDRSQPKKPKYFCGYMDKRLTKTRITRGKRLLKEHRDLLNSIRDDYGVPPRFLISLWGLETNFGDYLGDHSEIAALATLAYDPRRGDLFREQLFLALVIIEQGHRTPENFKGSWAGATGQVQFMPKTFLEFAVDYDGDGVKDIWDNPADSLATAARYMRASGWRPGETWGRQVALPAGMKRDAAALDLKRPLAEWQAQGVRRIDGGDLPAANLKGRVVLPLRDRDPSFLVYRNYRTFLTWNNSTFFAISVGTLADKLTEVGTLRICSD